MMSYMALYRKYRPKKFADVIGQETIVKILQKSIKEDKVAHAYLFSGPRGTGKTSIAKIMAKAVNCLSPNDGDLCGVCDNCVSLTENDNDIIEIDAASNNGVDEIREIRNNAKLVPNIGKYKVYIIDEVHMLSTGAFNALLKTLEEPPSHVIFILATTEIQKIPLTVLSRCQKYDFHKINFDTMKKHLLNILERENENLDENILDLVVKLSDGCCRDAINLLDQIISSENVISEEDVYELSGETPSKYLYDILDSIIDKNYQFGLETINYLTESGKNINNIINKLLILLRNISISKYNSKLFSESEKKVYDKYTNLDESYILNITKLFLELSNELKKSTMQKLIFEIYFMRMCNISNEKNNSLEQLSNSKMNVETDNVENQIIKTDAVKDDVEILNTKESVKTEVRINNALARADKKILLDLQNKFKNIDEYSSNRSFVNAFSILEESAIVVASDEYIILQFEYDSNVSLLNKNLKEVEELIKKVLGKKYKVSALTKNEWNDLKKEYISNRSKFVYQEENSENDSKEIEDITIENMENVSSVFEIFGEDSVTIK